MKIMTDATNWVVDHKKEAAAGCAVALITLVFYSRIIKTPAEAPVGTFKLTSYNTLAPTYAALDGGAWYSHIDPKLIDFTNRKQALLDHITSMGSEVICLQEVEPVLFKALKQKMPGYMAFHHMKPGHPEGVAFFFDKKTFLLEGTENVILGHNRPAQVVFLKHKGEPLAIVNTHLSWDAQGNLAHDQLKQLIKETINTRPEYKRWVICGDFNVEPNSRAVAYLKGQGFSYADTKNQVTVSIKANGTWYADKVDYIFSKNLPMEAEKIEQIGLKTLLPSEGHPSDHMAITAGIQIM